MESLSLFSLLFLFLITAVIVFLIQRHRHYLAGDPKIVEDILRQLGEDHTVLSDVVVSAELGMSKVCHVVISIYGVFVITVKTEAGKIDGKGGDRDWQVKSQGGRDIIYNPLWENRKHVNALEALIGPVWFIPAVVFTRANLKGEFGDFVLSLKELIPYIMRNRKTRLSGDKRDEIVKKLKAVSR